MKPTMEQVSGRTCVPVGKGAYVRTGLLQDLRPPQRICTGAVCSLRTAPMEGTYDGALHEELQPVGKTQIGEFHRELFPMGKTQH